MEIKHSCREIHAACVWNLTKTRRKQISSTADTVTTCAFTLAARSIRTRNPRGSEKNWWSKEAAEKKDWWANKSVSDFNSMLLIRVQFSSIHFSTHTIAHILMCCAIFLCVILHISQHKMFVALKQLQLHAQSGVLVPINLIPIVFASVDCLFSAAFRNAWEHGIESPFSALLHYLHNCFALQKSRFALKHKPVDIMGINRIIIFCIHGDVIFCWAGAWQTICLMLSSELSMAVFVCKTRIVYLFITWIFKWNSSSRNECTVAMNTFFIQNSLFIYCIPIEIVPHIGE